MAMASPTSTIAAHLSSNSGNLLENSYLSLCETILPTSLLSRIACQSTENIVGRFGLSYSAFGFAWAKPPSTVSSTQAVAAAGDDAALVYHVTVTNTGKIAAGIAVLAFVNASAEELVSLASGAASMPTPPLRELFNFTRVFLQSGAAAKLEFSLGREVLALSDDAGDQAVRAGRYTVAIGGVGRAGRPEDGAVETLLELRGKPQLLFSMGELRRRHTSAQLKVDEAELLSLKLDDDDYSLPDIGFTAANWSFPAGATVERGGPNGTTLCITGNPRGYIRAIVTIPKPEAVFSLIADTRLHAILPGSAEFDTPKIKVLGAEHMSTDYLAQNLQQSLDSVWITAALLVTPSKFAADTHLEFEIGMQQARGVFCTRSPRLSATIPEPTYSYPFAPPKSSLVELLVDPVTHRPVHDDLLSANSQLTSLARTGFGYSSSEMQEFLHWLHLPCLRFPGGTVGNFYNWRTDTFYEQNLGCTSISSERAASKYPFGFDGFAEAMHSNNASTILMMNVIDDNVSESVARLRARTFALPRIDWIELGNENYGSGQSCGHINPSSTNPPKAQDYLAFTTKLVGGLRSSGLIRVPPLAAPVQASSTWVDGGWNQQLTNSTLFDGFIMHPYVSVDDAIFTPTTAAKMLLASGVMRGHLQDFADHVDKQRPLLLTEFGILGTTTGSFIQTLGQASMYMGILDLSGQQNIVQAGIHILFAGSVNSPNALFSWDAEARRVVATCNGVVWRKFVLELQGSNLLGATSTGPELPGGSVPVSGVDIQAVRGAEGDLALLVVNKLGVPAQVKTTVAGQIHSVCGLEVFSQPPLSWESWAIADVDGLWTNETYESGEPIVSVPPVSVAVVRLCQPLKVIVY